MNTIELLDALQLKAKKDPELRKALFATRSENNPVDAFCKKCQEEGYPIYTMDLIQAGEEFYASMRRSTNGGGENSPKLEGEDDMISGVFCHWKMTCNFSDNIVEFVVFTEIIC